MKKYILLVLFVASSLVTLQAQTKLGTVDVNTILAKMPEIKNVNDGITAYNKELESGLKTKIDDYSKKLETYKQKEATASDVLKKTLQDELITLENDITKYRQNGGQLIQIRRDELLRPLYQKISDAIKTYAKEKKFTQILTTDNNEFAYVDDAYDITKNVMTNLGIKE